MTTKRMLNVDIKSIEYIFEKKLISSDIQFSLSKWDMLSIQWSTWCWKTTILKSLAWLYNKSSTVDVQWSVTLKGDSVLSGSCSEYISFLFQDVDDQFLLNTVHHEIYLPLDEKRRRLADFLVVYFGIQNFIGKLLKDLSSWERKIVALISVFALNRPIIFLDEPFANLDPENAKIVTKYLEEIRKDKIIIISSHGGVTKTICNKILVKKWRSRTFSQDDRQIYEEREKIAFKAYPYKDIIFSMNNIGYHYPDGKFISYQGAYQVNRWDIILLQWHNWSWKTTLINIISWKLTVSKGEIEINNISFWLILQEPEKQLFGNSVYEEVTLNIPKKNIDEDYIDSLLSLIWLYDKKHEHPFFLSRWQKQALLILSVILASPELLIFDEPFTGMDLELIDKVIYILQQHYQKTSCTIIFSDQYDEIYHKIVGLKKIPIRSFN